MECDWLVGHIISITSKIWAPLLGRWQIKMESNDCIISIISLYNFLNDKAPRINDYMM